MNKEQAKSLIDLLPLGVDISILIGTPGSGPVPDPEPEPEPETATHLVEIIDTEAFKEVDYYNNKGKPVMKSVRVGWKTTIGDRYAVEVEPIIGDGAVKYWRIWRGEDDDLSVFGCYISVHKTRTI